MIRNWRSTKIKVEQGRGLPRHTPGVEPTKRILTFQYSGMEDRWKGNLIRDIGSVSEVRRIERRANAFGEGLRGTYHEIDYISGHLQGKTRAEQFKWLDENPVHARVLQRRVDQMMGNWNALTHNERGFAPFLLFYPFMRFSLDWTFRTFPKRHPIKYAIALNLANATANQIQQMMGGRPSLFQQVVNVPYFGSETGGPTSLVPATRVVPGGNQLFSAAGAGDLTQLSGNH